MPNPPQSDPIRFGPFELHPASGELFKDGAPLSIQPQPLRLLHLLLSRSGELVTREELRQTLWPDGTTVDFDQGLNYCIRQIRAALGESADEPRYIETLPKRGYRFIAPLTAAAAHPPKPGIGLHLPLAALTIALAIFSVYLLTTKATPPPKLILVRPFVGLGLSPEQAWYSDALTQQLIGEMARTKSIRVLPWSTSLALKSQPASVSDLRRRFGAEAILEGSIRSEGKRWTVVSQLVDTQSESVLWSHRDERETSDLGQFEKDLLTAIASTLKLRFDDGTKSAANRRQLDPETNILYLKAASMKDQLSPNGAAQGAKAYEEVIRRQPDYAPAYAGLANLWATLPFLRKAPPEETLLKAAGLARQAIALDPALAEAHAALAHSYFNLWKWPEAEKEFQTALSLDPDSATTLQLYAVCLATQARFEEALARAESASRLAPTSGLMAYTIALVHFHAGHFDQAIAAARRTIDIDRGFLSARIIMIRAYVMKGMHKEALEVHLESPRSTTDKTTPLWNAHRQAIRGDKKEALATLRKWEQDFGKDVVLPVAYAVALLDCGDIERGFAALHKAVHSHATASIWLKTMPELQRWRTDARYQSALSLLDKETQSGTAL
jgi:DNA-binding winged helix-turn-helix (wHTH) protein/TolB-like protein/Tfp pilus assembly protein PilF